MPRKPKVIYAEQIYNLPQYGPEARVTVRYDANRPPPFFQPAPGVVIVGQYVAAGSSGTLPFNVEPPDRAEMEAIRARLEGRSQEPARPKILTPSDFVSPEFDAAVQTAIGMAEPVSSEGIDA